MPRPAPRQRTQGRNVEWGTPQWLYDWADKRYGPFDLDAAATLENAKCEPFFTEADDGLSQRWSHSRSGARPVWCNPPFAEADAWVRKALAESNDNANVMMLLPANTGTAWWHECVSQAAEIIFLRKKFKFDGAKHNSPFYCVLIWFRRGSKIQITRYVDPREPGQRDVRN